MEMRSLRRAAALGMAGCFLAATLTVGASALNDPDWDAGPVETGQVQESPPAQDGLPEAEESAPTGDGASGEEEPAPTDSGASGEEEPAPTDSGASGEEEPAPSESQTPGEEEGVPGGEENPEESLESTPPVEETFQPFGGRTSYTYASNDSEVAGWDASLESGDLSLAFGGKTGNPWYASKTCDFTYEDGTSGRVNITWNGAQQSGEYTCFQEWTVVDQGSIDIIGDMDGNYELSVNVPADALKPQPFTMEFCGASVTSEELGGVKEPEETPAPTPEPTPEPAAEPLVANARGKIEVDGKLDDWEKITAIQNSQDKNVDEWKVARDTEGNLYLGFTGEAASEWIDHFNWQMFTLTQNGVSEQFQTSISGFDFKVTNEASGNSAAAYYAELMIPASHLTDPNFSFEFAGYSVPAGSIPVVDGVPVEQGPDSGVYEGITIDGQYKDWNAVQRYPANDPNGYLENTSMVFDGDMVYIYIKERTGGGAAGAGTHGNGQYAITTDLGNMLMFQLNMDETISGVSGAEAKHVGNQWEIAIPASELPPYTQTINFGLYQHDPFISEVANLNGEGGGGSFSGIVYDGKYDDWDYYPHTLIQHATAGTQAEKTDAKGALWSEDSTLYGHFVSTMPEHIKEGGGEMAESITYRFNGSMDFYPKFGLEQPDGSVTWLGNQETMAMMKQSGEYRLKIGDSLDWQTPVYGETIITVTDGKIECEVKLDLELIAEKFGCSSSELRTIQAQYLRLGQEWVSITGTPSGAYLGILLSCGCVGGVLISRKGKNSKKGAEETCSKE